MSGRFRYAAACGVCGENSDRCAAQVAADGNLGYPLRMMSDERSKRGAAGIWLAVTGVVVVAGLPLAVAGLLAFEGTAAGAAFCKAIGLTAVLQWLFTMLGING